MKNLFILAIVLLVGCATTNPTTICNDYDQGECRICDIATERGVRLEDIGNGLIVASSIAIGEGVYTRAEAIRCMEEIKLLLHSPVLTGLSFIDGVDFYINKYPELITVAESYMSMLATPQVLDAPTRKIITAFLDERIEALKVSQPAKLPLG